MANTYPGYGHPCALLSLRRYIFIKEEVIFENGERESSEHASIHQGQQKFGRGMWKGEKR